MSDHIYLRMTIDVVLFADDDTSLKGLAATLVREGKGDWGVGTELAQKFNEKIRNGYIEIDEVRSVEKH